MVSKKNKKSYIPSTTNSLMPRTQMPLRTLKISMTVMCYLACLAIGALLLITRAVDDWTSEIAGEVTVQVRPTNDMAMKDKLAKAAKLLKATKGVIRVEVLDKSAGAKLLEPWLGNAQILDQLPVPQLIAVGIDQQNPPDFEGLSKKLALAVKGASLDTHRRWQSELTRMGTSLVWLGSGVLALITFSAIALVIFASRSALDVNREVVEVLHFVGASDQYIARQVQWQFLKAGMQAGLIGSLGSLATFFLLGLSSTVTSSNGLADASYSLLIGAPDVTLSSYVLFLMVPVLTTLICLIAARLAILRILGSTI